MADQNEAVKQRIFTTVLSVLDKLAKTETLDPESPHIPTAVTLLIANLKKIIDITEKQLKDSSIAQKTELLQQKEHLKNAIALFKEDTISADAIRKELAFAISHSIKSRKAA